MRILNENSVEISNPDLSLGYLSEEKILVAHHLAMEEVLEQWHYETIKEYSNGGKDVANIIDVAGVEAKEAWDEYETIQRYILYTDEQLKEIENQKNQPSMEERIAELEAQNEMLLQCVLEMSETVYA